MERGFDGDSGGMTPLTWYLMWEWEKGGKIRRGHIREGKGYGVCYSCETTIVVYLAWRSWCMILAARTIYAVIRS